MGQGTAPLRGCVWAYNPTAWDREAMGLGRRRKNRGVHLLRRFNNSFGPDRFCPPPQPKNRFATAKPCAPTIFPTTSNRFDNHF